MSNYKDLSFSTYQLFIDEKYAELSDFNINQAWNEDFEDKYQTIHNVRCDIYKEKYFTLYDNFGSPIPRPDLIYDMPTKTKLVNPRKNTQAELKNQLFCLYDTSKKILYMNNAKKKKFVEEYLNKKLSQEIIIKNVYKNIEDFTKTLKTLDKIEFIAHRNLFSNISKSFRNIKDLFGMDEPESFSLQAKYNISAGEQIKRVIENFRNEQTQIPNSCLTCIGKDDEGFEQIFNENTFSKTINFVIQPNNENLLNKDDVFNQLLGKLENNV